MNLIKVNTRSFQVTSILLVLIFITPMVYTNIIDENTFNFSIYENPKNGEKNQENENENNKEEKEVEELFLSLGYNQYDAFSLKKKFFFFDCGFSNDTRFEILTPPPEVMML